MKKIYLKILILIILKRSKYWIHFIIKLYLKRDDEFTEDNKSKEDEIHKNKTSFKMLFENDKNSKKKWKILTLLITIFF